MSLSNILEISVLPHSCELTLISSRIDQSYGRLRAVDLQVGILDLAKTTYRKFIRVDDDNASESLLRCENRDVDRTYHKIKFPNKEELNLWRILFLQSGCKNFSFQNTTIDSYFQDCCCSTNQNHLTTSRLTRMAAAIIKSAFTHCFSTSSAIDCIDERRNKSDRYETLELIGRGAFGIVKSARDSLTGEAVAVKLGKYNCIRLLKYINYTINTFIVNLY